MALEKDGTNVGSLCKIELVEVGKVGTVPEAYYGVIRQNVTLLEGSSWEDIYFTQDSAHFVERPVIIDGSEFHELIVKWKVPKDAASKQEYVMKAKAKRYVARLKDINGTVVIAGTKDEPCRVQRSLRDKGQNIRDSNHYIMELTLIREESAPVLKV